MDIHKPVVAIDILEKVVTQRRAVILDLLHGSFFEIRATRAFGLVRDIVENIGKLLVKDFEPVRQRRHATYHF